MEHYVVALPDDLDKVKKKLDELGAEGWELVTIIHQPIPKQPALYQSDFIAYFKKP